MAASEIIANAQSCLSNRGKERVLLWRTSLTTAIEDTSFLESNAQDLCALIVDTITEYNEANSRRAVKALINTALPNDTFLKVFAGSVLKQASGKPIRNEAFVLLTWTCSLLRHLDTSAKKAITRLIEVQGLLLTTLLESNVPWLVIARPVMRLLSSKPALQSDFIQAVASSANHGLVKVLLELGRRRPEFLQTHKQTFLGWYCDNILGAKELPTPAVTSAYSVLIKALTHEDLQAKIMPCINRMLKRTPELIMGILTAMLASISLDMSAYALELLPVLTQQIRGKESIRPTAIATVEALARHVLDPAALDELVGSVTSLLGATGTAKVKSVQERVAVVAVLSALCRAPGSDDAVGAAACSASDFIATFYKDEGSDDVKGALLASLALWAVRCPSLPPSVPTLLANGLKDPKDVLKKGHLRVAASLCASGPAAARQLTATASALARIVSDGVAKVALRADGLVALVAVAGMAAADLTVDQALEQEGMWAALKAESPLLAAATAAKVAPQDAGRVASLVQALLLHLPHRLPSGSQQAISQLLASLLLHHHQATRHAAATAAACILTAQPQRFSQLLDGLMYWMESPTACPTLQDPSLDDQTHAPTGNAPRYLHATLAYAPPSSSLPDPSSSSSPHPPVNPLEPTEYSQLLLAAHHPIAIGRHRPVHTIWEKLLRKSKPLSLITPGDVELVCAYLAGDSGLLSRSPSIQAAAKHSLGSMMALAPDTMYPCIMAAVGKLLDTSEHDAFSGEDIAMFETPEGQLVSEGEQRGVYVPEVVQSKNIRKPRGRFKSDKGAFGAQDSDDDDDPSPTPSTSSRPAPSAVGRGGAGARGAGGRGRGRDPKDRQEEMRQQRLAFEGEVRARVKAVQQRLQLGLSALLAAAVGNKPFTTSRLEEFSPLCLPLLSSPVVGEAAFATVRGICSCLPASIGSRALSVAAALRMVALARQGGAVSYSDIPSSPHVADVIKVLAKATDGRKSLPAPAYSFIFPILESVLMSPVHTPLHDQALQILSLHVSPGTQIPRSESLVLLYHLLEVIPAQRDKVLPLLRSLCAGAVEPSEVITALTGLLSRSALVRAVCLAALPEVPCIGEGICPSDPEVTSKIFIAMHDVNDANRATAVSVYEMATCQIPGSYVPALVRHLASTHEDIRSATSEALAAAMQLHPATRTTALEAILAGYAGGSTTVAAKLGVAAALKAAACAFAEEGVLPAMHFLISMGLADEDASVREAMVAAGMAIIDLRGGKHAQAMLPLFEGFLDKSRARGSHDEETRYDIVREGVVIFLGTLARHLPSEDPKRRVVVGTLVEVLATPSEGVQRAASNCMGPLVAGFKSDPTFLQTLISDLLDRCLTGTTYGEKRGAAYGVAGVVKGLGTVALRTFKILDSLKASLEHKTDAKAREGALLALECMCDKLKNLFEPYIIPLLPLLLNSFGDSQLPVRHAAEDTARVIMRNLTASGVKMVLPALLKGLEDKLWRTKQGSIQMLGAMAYCAPRQLGTCLPTIVPRLTEVLSDPHPKVQAAAEQALNEVGSVIRNPEVLSLVPTLLAAVREPNTLTKSCLDTLLGTTFVNTIDAPSLALIIPVVHRGLRDRAGDTKRRASRIVGNMCQLVNDAKDMSPYVPVLMPELQKSLVDPLPDVRATAARAMGSLLHGMGQEHFQDLLPWLLTTLKSDGSSVERSGAAQGLAEVLAVLGHEHVEGLLPQLLASCSSRNPLVREGHLTLFRYLPQTMEDLFQTYLPRCLPSVLDGLSDESEGVRDAALSAGRTFVDLYATTALPVLLPAVEEGVFNDNWRIRQSSVELLGELLFKVAGTTGKVVLDGGSDDEGAATEFYGRAIIEKLGHDHRNRVLSRVYVARSDVQYTVRNAALHVWKSVVVNTPKTLGEILPNLMQMVIISLADEGEDRKQTSARCLGELVRKMGERVLGKIVPILRAGMDGPDPAQRQGVCFGLKEVLENISRHQLLEYLPDVLPPVQAALCDPDADVREAAGGAFSILFRGGAGSAVDTVVPTLLAGLELDAKYAQSLEGLRVILGVRPTTLNAIVPRLLRPPMLSNNVRAVGALADVAGSVLHNHLGTIYPSLLPLASRSDGSALADAARQSCVSVASAVEEEGIHLLFAELEKGLEDPKRRKGSALLISSWIKSCKLEVDEHLPGILTALVGLLAEEDEDVVMACWKGLEAVTSTVPKEEQAGLVRCIKEAVQTARERERRKRKPGQLRVAGFCLPPKALAPVLPIYVQGVMQGLTPEAREMAADAIGELVEVTSEEAMKPFVVMMTGPLIRIVGDRFPSGIKAAILLTLGRITAKGATAIKPFVPQLQTTYLKCLRDEAANVRSRAAANLGELTRMSLRVDQLATDLATTARLEGDPLVRQGYLSALQGTLLASGSRLSPATISTIGDALSTILPSTATGGDEQLMISTANCYGVYCRHCTPEDLATALASGPLGPAPSDWEVRYAHAALLASACRYAAEALEAAGLTKGALDAAVAYSRDEKIQLKVASGRAACRLLAAAPELSAAPAVNVMVALLGPDQSSEVQRQVLMSIRRVAEASPKLLEPHLQHFVPSMCSLVQTTFGPTKATCERALQKVLALEASLEVAQRYLASNPGPMVRAVLTEQSLRRLQKLPDDDDLDAEEF